MPDEAPVPPPPRRRRVQLPLRTLILLVAALAVWMTVATNRRHAAALRQRLDGLRPLVHALIVEDPDRFAVVKRDPLWYDETIWDVHVPPGAFRLALATRGIPGTGLVPPAATAPIGPGRHTLTIETRQAAGGWRVVVTLDGKPALTRDEPAAWNPGRGSSGGGQFDASTQAPADRPLVLFQRVFTQPDPNGSISFSTPSGPSAGVLLWIEPDPGR